MRLDNIKIKDSFAASNPKQKKLLKCKEHWDKNHTQDRYLVVDHNYTLIDGYIQYLVLKDVGIDIAEIKISDKKMKKWKEKQKKRTSKIEKYNYKTCSTLYVFGVHLHSESAKERVWRVPNSWKDS